MFTIHSTCACRRVLYTLIWNQKRVGNGPRTRPVLATCGPASVLRKNMIFAAQGLKQPTPCRAAEVLSVVGRNIDLDAGRAGQMYPLCVWGKGALPPSFSPLWGVYHPPPPPPQQYPHPRPHRQILSFYYLTSRWISWSTFHPKGEGGGGVKSCWSHQLSDHDPRCPRPHSNRNGLQVLWARCLG